jgi:lipoprotein-anchoring transpeptidase ErfK/SrfK
MWMIATLVLAAEAVLSHEEPHRKIVVSIPDRMLALVENGQTVKIYPTAVGANRSPSPSGEFRIMNRVERPTWYGPKQVIGPGRANPLGTRWLGLSVKGYGIHGTNRPSSIGHNASHGCIRMRNADVEDLFQRVRVGDPVILLRVRNAETAALFGDPSHGGPEDDGPKLSDPNRPAEPVLVAAGQ